jgi:hypothetical protein
MMDISIRSDPDGSPLAVDPGIADSKSEDIVTVLAVSESVYRLDRSEYLLEFCPSACLLP